METIKFKDVSVSYDGKKCFEHFSFDMEHNRDVCLIGQNAIGKTSLLKTLTDSFSFEGTIEKGASCSILLHPFNSNSKISEILQFDYLKEDERRYVRDYLKLNSLDYIFSELSVKFQLKISILKKVLMRPSFFFLDDILSAFSFQEKKELISLLHELHITLFYVTSNMEDTLLFPYLIVTGKEGILIEGATLSVLKEEKILRRLGFSLPFYVDLSLQLQSYGLINQVYTDRKELTDSLWKSN